MASLYIWVHLVWVLNFDVIGIISMLGPKLNLCLKFNSGTVLAWINLANFCSQSAVEACDWIAAFVMAICQGIILNTNATQSSTANVARAIMIVLIMVKYSILQMNPSQNSPRIFAHLPLRQIAGWSFWSPFWSGSYFLVSISSWVLHFLLS